MTLTPLAPFDGEAIVSLAAARAHCRVVDGDEDELIGGYRDAAIDWLEGYTARGLSVRAWRCVLSAFPGGAAPYRLPMGPVTGVTAIDWLDQSATLTSLAASDWRWSGEFVAPAAGLGWPMTGGWADAARITFTAGYAAPPPALLAAVKLLLGHLYNNREAVVTSGLTPAAVPLGVVELCRPFRAPVIG